MSYIGQIPIPQATEERIERTATAGQTSYTGLTYVNGFISVYLNGVKLDNADFTATDGTTVTLGTGAAAGDTVSFVSTTQTSALMSLPLKDSAGNSVLSESAGVVTLENVTFPAGHILQVAQGFSQASIATTSQSFTASALTTGLPELASTSNKVLVQMIGGLADVNTGSVNVAYQLHESIAGGSYSLVTNAQNDTHLLDATNRYPYAMSYLFTPNAGNGTTSRIDVKIYFKTSANQGFLNYVGNLISLTIMEIAQ